jgi:polar amino acid transport system substrate-binding protein
MTPPLRRLLRGWLAALVLFACAASAAQAQSLDAIQKRGKLLVGIDLSVPPFGLTNAQMEPDGYDVQIATLLAKDLGVPMVLVPVTGATRIPTLLTGKVDLIVSVMSISPERAKSVTFTNPYGLHQSIVVAPAATKIATLADLSGKRVGVARGTAYEDYLVKAAIPGLQLVRFDDDSANLNALATGQVDAIGTVTFLANELNKRYPDRGFERKIVLFESVYSMAIRHGDPDFLRWLNTVIFFHDRNGDIPKLYETWMGEKLKPLPTF